MTHNEFSGGSAMLSVCGEAALAELAKDEHLQKASPFQRYQL